MSTEKQIAANHRNAQLSTGPRTPDGKARSSLNALTHGLTAAQILIPSESADDFESHAASFRDRFAPVDSVESFLVDQMIVAAWRLRRTRFLESKIFAQRAFEVDRHQKEREEELTDAADHIVTGYRRECSGTNSLENISRQETRIERAFYRALHELNRLRNPKGKTPSEPILQNEPNFPSSASDLVPSNAGNLSPVLSPCGAGDLVACDPDGAEPNPSDIIIPINFRQPKAAVILSPMVPS
jgi:hypothetical protein